MVDLRSSPRHAIDTSGLGQLITGRKQWKVDEHYTLTKTAWKTA
eukprot:gene7014-16745_t